MVHSFGASGMDFEQKDSSAKRLNALYHMTSMTPNSVKDDWHIYGCSCSNHVTTFGFQDWTFDSTKTEFGRMALLARLRHVITEALPSLQEWMPTIVI
jgi:hypothetical protein